MISNMKTKTEHKNQFDKRRVLRVVAVAGLMLFLLGFSLRQESRRQQLMELVGYWVAEDIRENRHSFFPDDSAAYVPWHTDDGGRLKGVSFREDGLWLPVYMDEHLVRYE